MMPRTCLASVIANGVAKHIAKRSLSVAINRGTQEIQPTHLSVFISPSVPREVVE